MPTQPPVRTALLALSHELGQPERNLALLGEGNTSARLNTRSFVVKASGSNLATLARGDVTACAFARLLPLLSEKDLDDAAIDAALYAARTNPRAKKPSVEAIFHAWLLTLPEVNFVGHTHPVAVNQVLCSHRAAEFAYRRMFPDEIVCCGESSVLVPYVDPGLRLAQAIRTAVTGYIRRLSRPPRVILLENHGLIALGATPAAVLAATLMSTKAAEIFVGAASFGEAPRSLSAAQVARIAGRPDEHYRQKALGL
jgi:rhamnose utilization protein RhaD (predicted bifunctional aldolase and dehydrogenase)